MAETVFAVVDYLHEILEELVECFVIVPLQLLVYHEQRHRARYLIEIVGVIAEINKIIN